MSGAPRKAKPGGVQEKTKISRSRNPEVPVRTTVQPAGTRSFAARPTLANHAPSGETMESTSGQTLNSASTVWGKPPTYGRGSSGIKAPAGRLPLIFSKAPQRQGLVVSGPKVIPLSKDKTRTSTVKALSQPAPAKKLMTMPKSFLPTSKKDIEIKKFPIAEMTRNVTVRDRSKKRSPERHPITDMIMRKFGGTQPSLGKNISKALAKLPTRISKPKIPSPTKPKKVRRMNISPQYLNALPPLSKGKSLSPKEDAEAERFLEKLALSPERQTRRLSKSPDNEHTRKFGFPAPIGYELRIEGPPGEQMTSVLDLSQLDEEKRRSKLADLVKRYSERKNKWVARRPHSRFGFPAPIGYELRLEGPPGEQMTSVLDLSQLDEEKIRSKLADLVKRYSERKNKWVARRPYSRLEEDLKLHRAPRSLIKGYRIEAAAILFQSLQRFFYINAVIMPRDERSAGIPNVKKLSNTGREVIAPYAFARKVLKQEKVKWLSLRKDAILALGLEDLRDPLDVLKMTWRQAERLMCSEDKEPQVKEERAREIIAVLSRLERHWSEALVKCIRQEARKAVTFCKNALVKVKIFAWNDPSLINIITECQNYFVDTLITFYKTEKMGDVHFADFTVEDFLKFVTEADRYYVKVFDVKTSITATSEFSEPQSNRDLPNRALGIFREGPLWIDYFYRRKSTFDRVQHSLKKDRSPEYDKKSHRPREGPADTNKNLMKRLSDGQRTKVEGLERKLASGKY